MHFCECLNNIFFFKKSVNSKTLNFLFFQFFLFHSDDFVKIGDCQRSKIFFLHLLYVFLRRVVFYNYRSVRLKALFKDSAVLEYKRSDFQGLVYVLLYLETESIVAFQPVRKDGTAFFSVEFLNFLHNFVVVPFYFPVFKVFFYGKPAALVFLKQFFYAGVVFLAECLRKFHRHYCIVFAFVRL